MLTANACECRGGGPYCLPGVGAFADCAAGLDALDGMTEALRERVLIGGKPFLGICVGMQWPHDEREVTNGLDWLPGHVQKLEVDSTAYKIPHMGWNTLMCRRAGFGGLDGESVYFVHSYAFRPDDINCLATTTHGASFASVVGHNNVIGTISSRKTSMSACVSSKIFWSGDHDFIPCNRFKKWRVRAT